MIAVVQEHSSDKYSPRTYFNAKSADLTVAFAVDLNTAGEKCTQKAAGANYIGFKIDKTTDSLYLARALYTKVNKKKCRTLNIAGNGIYTLSENGWSQSEINNFVFDVISKVTNYHKIDKIFTGGQTGVDLAGAVTAECLGIPSVITLPKGYIQRFENKQDVSMTKQDIEDQIMQGVSAIKNKLKG